MTFAGVLECQIERSWHQSFCSFATQIVGNIVVFVRDCNLKCSLTSTAKDVVMMTEIFGDCGSKKKTLSISCHLLIARVERLQIHVFTDQSKNGQMVASENDARFFFASASARNHYYKAKASKACISTLGFLC